MLQNVSLSYSHIKPELDELETAQNHQIGCTRLALTWSEFGILDENGIRQKNFWEFKADGLMDLNVDKLTKNTIVLAHNGVQNGDVMADPDMEIRIYPGLKEAEALAFQNDYLGIYQEVYTDGKCNAKIKKDLNEFLADWLQNIIDCEYKLVEKEG